MDSFAGKTCLVRRFTQGVFPPGQGATIGVDFMIKTVVVDNEKIKVSSFIGFLSHSLVWNYVLLKVINRIYPFFFLSQLQIW